MINVGVFNANGLTNKADCVHSFIATNKISIMLILETQLCPNISPIFSNPLINITRPRPPGPLVVKQTAVSWY